MRARMVAGGIVSSAAVLVIGWQLGAQPAVTTPVQQGTTSGSASSGSGTSGTSTGTGTSTASGTFTGTTAQTRYGPVQVEITVAGGKITEVTALQLTNQDGRSVAISQQAAPILRQEALQAQSAKIQAVSGATYTSDGYVTSLQSAIDQAGL
ncbi:FMN-binding protein [Curtobacterium sp. MCLR17_007]|uniref:FMN-binding protein n=1 Tax=Curtobacterium sp. MCLR17_007 TaxID=2175648 RepID=UPI0021AC5E30|nr:FMN-binding protein [Curtobacterium sp. MCLR17_007]WIB61662.1 FMN-binding protein [Curtobacterium sp. MCLR17_007]